MELDNIPVHPSDNHPCRYAPCTHLIKTNQVLNAACDEHETIHFRLLGAKQEVVDSY